MLLQQVAHVSVRRPPSLYLSQVPPGGSIRAGGAKPCTKHQRKQEKKDQEKKELPKLDNREPGETFPSAPSAWSSVQS